MLNIVLVLRRVDGVQAKPDLAARQTRHRATSRDPPSKSPRQNDPHELRRVRRPTGPHRAAMFAVRYEILQIGLISRVICIVKNSTWKQKNWSASSSHSAGVY